MAKGINISIASDVRAFQSGVDDVTKSLDNVTKELDQATQSGDAAGQSIQQAMERAQQATAGESRQVEQAARTWSDFRPAVLQSDEALQRATHSAERAGTTYETVGQKAAQSGEKIQEGGKLGEAAMMNVGFSAMQAGTLFTGGVSSMTEQVGTFAAFMGPSMAGIEGAIGGLAWPITIAGVGLAALGGIIGQTTDDTKGLTQATNDLVNEFEGGIKGINDYDSALRAWAKDSTDYGGEGLAETARDVKSIGLGFNDVAGTITGKSIPAINQMLRTLDNIKEMDDKLAESPLGTAKTIKAAEDEAAANDRVREALSKRRQALQDAENEEKVMAEAMGMTVAQYQAYEQAVQQAQTDQDNWTSAVSQSFSQAATASDDYLKGQAVNWQQEQTNLQEVIDAYNKFPVTISQLTKDGLDAAGKEFAESNFTPAQLEQFMTLPPDQRAKMVSQWNEAGKDAKKGLADGISAGDLSSVTVPVKADTSAAKSEIKKTADEKHTSTIDTKLDTKGADNELDSIATKKRTATIRATADTKSADDGLDATASKRRTATIKTKADLGDATAALDALARRTFQPTVKPTIDMSSVNHALDSIPRSITVTLHAQRGKDLQ
ncbi:hypothetical protein GCM10027414_07170 [Humibacter ginsengiterrae]